MKPFANAIAVAVVSATASSVAWAADPATITWSAVPAKTLKLFYPAQSTYQWLRSPAHAGAAMVKSGGACVACHSGQEEKLGNNLVKAGPLEPAAPEGKNGVLPLSVQVAYDSEFAYFRLQWKTRNAHAGDAYPMYRYDGKEWKLHGGPRLNASVRKGEQPPVYEDRRIDDDR